MLPSLAVLVLLLSLATATPVVCLCMPTEQGYQSFRSEGVGAAQQQEPAQQPVRAAVAALALISTAVAPAADAGLATAAPGPERLMPRPLTVPSEIASAPPAPPPRGSA